LGWRDAAAGKLDRRREENIQMRDFMALKMIGAGRVVRAAVVLAACLVVAGVLGAGVFGAGAEAQTRTERFFDDWNVLCMESQDGVKRCRMTQALVRTNPRREVFRWVVVANQEAELENILSAPLGVALRPGVELLVEGAEPISVPYEVCGRQWCQARVAMVAAVVDTMAAGSPVQVTYVNQRGQRLRMEVTARGYRDALDYLQSQLGS
jgi:invasion protein IalB